MSVVDIFQWLLHWAFSIQSLLLFLFAALAVGMGMQARRRGAQRNSLVGLFSSLQTFDRSFDQRGDLEKIAQSALDGTLKALGAKQGLVFLEGEAGPGSGQISGCGLSAIGLEKLSAKPMRIYLALCPQRWGNLLALGDLGAGKLQSGPFGPEFHEFVNIMKQEGLRSLLILGLATPKGTNGTLVAARRRRHAFKPEELRLAAVLGNQINTALENWRSARERERQEKSLRTLDLVGRAMRESFDLHEQVAILQQHMQDLLPGCQFSLAAQDSPNGPFETAVAFERLRKLESPLGAKASGFENEVVRTRTPLLIAEKWQWARYHSSFPPGTPPILTWCGVPVTFSDGSKGVLSVANFERERAITTSQLDLICVVAHEAAGAFENARAFRREQRRASHLALLNEIGRRASSVLNSEELLPHICIQVREAFGLDWVRLEVCDPQTDELVVQAEAGCGKEFIGRRTRLGKGLSGTAAMQGEPVVANWDPTEMEEQHPMLAPDALSGVSLPLAYQNELLGVLTLESRRQQAFSSQDVLTLKTLADQLAIALRNARAYQNAVEEAITDGLTGLKTHRYFMEALEREMGRSHRSGRPFAVVMMDLDRFKLVNDQNGHLEGDRVLRLVAKLLGDQLRQSSVLARYGGDEFSMLLPDTTEEEAQRAAERFRNAIEKEPSLATRHVTASFGIAVYPQHGATRQAILQVADMGMYVAKHAQGNRVCGAMPVPHYAQVEAYLDVEFKRKFSTGPAAFNEILQHLEKAVNANAEVKVVDAVTSLARAIDISDHYTRFHGQAVSRVAAQIARQMGLRDEEVAEIRRAGILHDIGKIGVPHTILYKPGPLTKEEYTVMQGHSVNGQKILEPLKVAAVQRIGLMVRHHHEKFDGGGYPDHLKGHEIPLGARILTLADSFDTMISERGYKKARTLEEAIAELLRCSDTHFDSELVQAFLRSLETYGDPRDNTVWDQEDNSARVEIADWVSEGVLAVQQA
jgi:diguanylate cyclase (GGDEF)-like protein/putative nucleotidyltransferase with HDIG domain